MRKYCYILRKQQDEIVEGVQRMFVGEFEEKCGQQWNVEERV